MTPLSPAPLFHDAAFFRTLRTSVAPQLRTWPSVNVWLVEAATGDNAPK